MSKKILIVDDSALMRRVMCDIINSDGTFQVTDTCCDGLEDFVGAGADLITVHAESCKHLDRTIASIKERGILAGVALNPATPLQTVEYVLEKVDMVLIMTVNPGFGGQKFIPYTLQKVRDLKKMIDARGLKTDIEVDGGVNLSNVEEILSAGANIIVAGSAVFNGDVAENTQMFLDILNS